MYTLVRSRWDSGPVHGNCRPKSSRYRKWEDRRGRRRISKRVGSGADQLGRGHESGSLSAFLLMRSHLTACPVMAEVGDPVRALRPSSKPGRRPRLVSLHPTEYDNPKATTTPPPRKRTSTRPCQDPKYSFIRRVFTPSLGEPAYAKKTARF
ncbi:hypothetical protein CGRA01v4_02043 [Colletotrichum graminicola]|nr:hypothetical protein CGRA01v4_02043 [Colletotrichum graminicola]